jgi:carboxyl-terminal processing protease
MAADRSRQVRIETGTNMLNRWTLSLGAFALASLSIAASDAPQAESHVYEPLIPLASHSRTSVSIVNELRNNHYYPRRKIDDSVSAQVFDKYIDRLDSDRAYFLAADVENLDEKYRFSLDEALKQGDLAPAFDIFNLFQQRMVDRLEYVLSFIDYGLDTFDFTVDESLEIDRENAPWPQDRDEMDALWRKRVKAWTLEMLLNDREIDDIEETLAKRYRNRLRQLTKTKRETRSEEAFQVYINAFTNTYDPHTEYFSPRNYAQFNINMSLSLEGIGAVLRPVDEYTSIVSLVPAGPADKSGALKPLDRIIGVGQGETDPIIDVVGMRLDEVVDLIRGPKGSIVRLQVIGPNAGEADSRIVQITRNKVMLEEQAAQKKLLEYEIGGRERKIGVIEIPSFYADPRASGRVDGRTTTRDVVRLIEELKEEGIEGIVVDLRNNGGGSLEEAKSLTGLFIESGPVLQVSNQGRRAQPFPDTDSRVDWNGPLAVLVNRLSASASEIFAGAIQAYQRGIITGGRTFGKGTVQTLLPLNRGQLKITQAKYYLISGQSTQHQGVIPDIELPESYDVQQIGESALDGAMPWGRISPADYSTSNAIAPFVGELQAAHVERVADDPDFQYLRALTERDVENRARTHISLNRETREQERATDDERRLGIVNARLQARGEPLVESIEEWAALSQVESGAFIDAPTTITPITDGESNEESGEGPPEENPLDDPMLRETGRILLDYIGLNQQVAMVEGEDAATP